MPTLSFRQRLVIAIVGYSLLLAFAVIYVSLGRYMKGLTTNQLLILSAVAVAPLALAVVWEHLKGVKVGKVEIKLSDVSPRLDIELASGLADLRASVTPALANLITNAVNSKDFKLVELNLRSQPYWWSTRLYLVAALAEEYTSIEQFVIVEKDAARIFIGTATPAGIRKALAQNFPELERVFRLIQPQSGGYGPDPVSVITNIIHRWSMESLFSLPGQATRVSEVQFKQLITPATLSGWLGNALETETRDWKGERPTRALYARILSCDRPYVPLVHGRRLAKVVNRADLAAKLATSAMS